MATRFKLQIKQKMFIFLCVFTTLGLCAQDQKERNNGNNEFKVNMGSLLFEFPEISYEHILNEESSIGVSVAFAIDKEIDYKFIIYPNYRLYFGDKRTAGFFIEANSAVFSERSHGKMIIGSVNNQRNNTEIGLGLGLAVGGKFLTKNGFIGEIYIGGGRNFINTDKISEGYPRIGISIGKRF